jgi:hypothetical protein
MGIQKWGHDIKIKNWGGIFPHPLSIKQNNEMTLHDRQLAHQYTWEA